jgi:peptide/nickel transport system permease protein
MELILGVLLGGISGYYGGWVDNLIMRIVDVFNCIPSIPVMLILGSVMISLKVPPQDKIYVLMLVLGLLGWPGVARIVRGQILSLREQEFMVAAEATGLRPMRKIFKHLVPNVMPQLIVIATLGIGSVILTESAMSFLGIGLSFPYASWGNMVDAVNDPEIMRNCLNIWVPPGICILLTVMSFNLVGDGLRDAFDPKMKR